MLAGLGSNGMRFTSLNQSGKSTSGICFRIDPHKFDQSSSDVRNVNGLFFPTRSERRIHLSHDKIEQVINFIKYSYNITKNI